MLLRSAIALGCALAAPTALAANDWSFKNVSVNWLDWSDGTETRTNAGFFGGKKDFAYLELEGGCGGDWGEAYGFFDIENPGKGWDKSGKDDSRRVASKAVVRFNVAEVGGLPLQVYTHLYDVREDGFFDQNRVLGLGTSWRSGNFWVKPFIGAHQELKSGVGAHFNGCLLYTSDAATICSV